MQAIAKPLEHNLGGDLGISHMAMDKSPKIQAEIERAMLPVSQTR